MRLKLDYVRVTVTPRSWLTGLIEPCWNFRAVLYSGQKFTALVGREFWRRARSVKRWRGKKFVLRRNRP